MNVESSFLKDRPANKDELRGIIDETPHLRSPGRYKDLYSLDAAEFEGIPSVNEFYESLERWTFRLN